MSPSTFLALPMRSWRRKKLVTESKEKA
ncbi:predicted protein [Fibroporia radiculosa]|uniref:Uncharacterized protein n=1 Tax=Fibroporia radiculosa TaxID=599839 RepID=J7S6G8_9APHY|nr:predicted protein [Fibroporia radiculosa]